MLGVLSLLFLFLILFFLISFFHFFCWKNMGVNFSGIRSWMSSFECGFLGRGLVESSFSFTYFILLDFFVIFDLEISLLLNLPFQGVLFKKFPYYLLFMCLVCFGYIAEVVKGYMSWGY